MENPGSCTLNMKTRERWDRKVDRIMWKSANEVENAQCESATRTVPCMVHAEHEVRGMATLPHHPQVHNRTDISVLRRGSSTRLEFALCK